ncbi:MAG: hypothetical protein U5L05_03030 [Rubrivivax sp.]|nr:hypothetical protein [Rubrivivax sp.]
MNANRYPALIAGLMLALQAAAAWAQQPDLAVQKVEYIGGAKHGACNTARITVFNHSTTPVTADIPVVHAVDLGEGELARIGTMAGGIGGKTAKSMQLSNVDLATYAVNLTQVFVDRANTIPESNEANNALMTAPQISGHCAKLSVADVNAKEGKPLRFVISLSPTTDLPVSVDYAVSSSAAQAGTACGRGADFVAAQGKLQFSKGESSKTVAVETCSDAQNEGLEGVKLTLSRSSNAELAKASATGAITD